MQEKILQALGIPFAAFCSIIFGMMILSFPIGAYIVFNTDIGDEINFEYPIDVFAEIGIKIPGLELGDAFIIMWGIYAVIFAVAILGPKKNFFRELAPTMNEGKNPSSKNYMVMAIKWFVILVLASTAINVIQESLGITTEPPDAKNDLIRFFDVTRAPLLEEIGFRVILIGLPLFALYAHKFSVRHFFGALWHPSENLHIAEKNRAVILVIVTAVFFGMAHVIFGDAWSSGKFAQATASGIIIGWVYLRYGLAPAILIHWATNYFIFSYAYLVTELNFVTVQEAFGHSMLQTLEIIFVVAGAISVAMIIAHRQIARKPAE